MNTKLASSLAAAAFTSACASAPAVVAEDFPPAVVWGQSVFPQRVADAPLVDGGEFPAPVVAGVSKFRVVAEGRDYHAAAEFPPEVQWVSARVPPVAQAGIQVTAKAR